MNDTEILSFVRSASPWPALTSGFLGKKPTRDERRAKACLDAFYQQYEQFKNIIRAKRGSPSLSAWQRLEGFVNSVRHYGLAYLKPWNSKGAFLDAEIQRTMKPLLHR